MTGYGLARVIGVAAIALLGSIVGTFFGPAAALLISPLFDILNTAMLFLLVTMAYEWNARQRLG